MSSHLQGVYRHFMNKGLYTVTLFVLAVLFLVLQSPLLINSVGAQATDDEQKIWICHAPRTDKFEALLIDKNGAENGHGGGKGTHSDDIVPAFGEFPGLNWTEDNQAYWQENCFEQGEVLGDTCLPGPGFAHSVINFEQGTRKNYTPVSAARSYPESVLGAPDATTNPESGFYSLGINGWVIVDFDGYVTDEPGNDLSFHEVTNGRATYPEEKIDVEVSQNGTDWIPLGTVSSNNEINYLDLNGSGLTWIKYVKISDSTNFNFHNSIADGYDIDAVDATNITCDKPELTPCEQGNQIFMIGDDELIQTDNPADEFSFNGFGDFSKPVDDPFVVGVSPTEKFPWNSNYNQAFATDFKVNFFYNSSETLPEATLTVAWGPGRSALENKIISLDGNTIGNLSHQGMSVGGWFSNMQIYDDVIVIENFTPGWHTLRFEHTQGDGTLWDYVKLEQSTCPEVAQEPEEQGPVGEIRGLIYEDVNGDNIQDTEKESPLVNWSAILLTHNSPFKLADIYVTGADGVFLFEHLDYGTYYVCQDIQEGWLQTQISAGMEGVDITSLSIGDVLGNSPELHNLVDDYCYQVVLTEQNPKSTNNIFGNTRNIQFESDVLGTSTTNDDAGVLGASTLSSTGQNIFAAGLAAFAILLTSVAVIFRKNPKF